MTSARSEIAETDRLVRMSDLIAADMDGETVMMSVENGAYFGLRGVGNRVWDLLETPCSLHELTETVISEYAVDRDTCQDDLREFLKNMVENGLVRKV